MSFDDVAFEPKPVQKPSLSFWIGGDAKPALRRVAKFGSGWWPFRTAPEDIPAGIDYIKSQPSYDGHPFDVMLGLARPRVTLHHEAVEGASARPPMSPAEIVDGLGRLTELGVTYSSVPTPRVDGVQAHLDYAQWVIEEIKPQLR